MHLRNAVEDAVRRWDALEKSRGESPVIDFDCAPATNKPRPFDNRFAALDELSQLGRHANTRHPALKAQLDAHIAYLRALIGEQLPFDQYILMTQGCMARGWSPNYVEHRAQMAKDALELLRVSWNSDTWANVRSLSEQLPVTDVASAIEEYAERYEPIVRGLVDTNTKFNLTIEDAEVDAYWSYWLDGAGHDARLRINKKNASFSRVDAYRFALHEVLGHALQYSSLTAQAELNIVEWPRILAVHCPHQVLFEGLAQVLPWIACSEDQIVTVRTRLDHFTNLIRGQIHVMLNGGSTIVDCRDFARQVPWWTDEEVAREFYDRSRSPQFKS